MIFSVIVALLHYLFNVGRGWVIGLKMSHLVGSCSGPGWLMEPTTTSSGNVMDSLSTGRITLTMMNPSARNPSGMGAGLGVAQRQHTGYSPDSSCSGDDRVPPFIGRGDGGLP